MSQEVLNIHFTGAKHKSKAARDKMNNPNKDKIVPEGGLIVEGGRTLKPGNVQTSEKDHFDNKTIFII